MNLGADCKHCPLAANGSPPVIPVRPARRRYQAIILGEGPGRNEVKQNEYFVGRSGDLLNETLQREAWSRAKCFIANTTLCMPAAKPKLSPKQWRTAIQCCQPRLQAELAKHAKGKPILALGSRALLATTGKHSIFAWMGAKETPIPEFSKHRWILPTLHPAFTLREPAYIPVFHIHLHRMKAFVDGAPDWEWPACSIAPNKSQIAALRRILKRAEPVGVDIETRGNRPLKAPITNIGIADRHEMISVQYPLPNTNTGRQIDTLVRRILASQSVKVMQNGFAFDRPCLEKHGYEIDGQAFDTMYAAAVIAPNVRRSLALLSAYEFPAPRWKDSFKNSGDVKGSKRISSADPTERAIYNARDAFMTVLLYHRYQERLPSVHNGQALLDEYHELGALAQPMLTGGVWVAWEHFARHKRVLRSRRTKAFNRLMRITEQAGMPDFNPRSNRQITTLFAKKLKVLPTKFSKITGQPSFDATVLQDLCTHRKPRVRDCARALLSYRKEQKLLSTYIDSFPDLDGRVHPIWDPTGARTGRWGCKKPNMMNVPKAMRNMFRAKPKHFLISMDYGALELKVLALLARDEVLLQAFEQGIDVHAMNTEALFGIEIPVDKAERTKEHGDLRTISKRFVFGSNYGAAPESLWAKLVVDAPDLTLAVVCQMHRRWYRKHACIRHFQQKMIARARRHDHIQFPLSGRRQWFYGQVKETECANYPIQGTAADIMNPATLRIARRFRDELSGHARLIIQVHDELTAETDRPIEAFKIMKEEMERPVEIDGRSFSFSTSADISIYWAAPDKIGREISTITHLRKAVAALRKHPEFSRLTEIPPSVRRERWRLKQQLKRKIRKTRKPSNSKRTKTKK